MAQDHKAFRLTGRLRGAGDWLALAPEHDQGQTRRVGAERMQLPDVDAERRFKRCNAQRFDRIAFAMRALDVLRPDANVAVYPRSLDLRIERGRDLARGPHAVWALVGIPPDASREHIAFALAELAGLETAPFVVDLLARL